MKVPNRQVILTALQEIPGDFYVVCNGVGSHQFCSSITVRILQMGKNITINSIRPQMTVPTERKRGEPVLSRKALRTGGLQA
jgi:hypothetical protein